MKLIYNLLRYGILQLLSREDRERLINEVAEKEHFKQISQHKDNKENDTSEDFFRWYNFLVQLNYDIQKGLISDSLEVRISNYLRENDSRRYSEGLEIISFLEKHRKRCILGEIYFDFNILENCKEMSEQDIRIEQLQPGIAKYLNLPFDEIRKAVKKSKPRVEQGRILAEESSSTLRIKGFLLELNLIYQWDPFFLQIPLREKLEAQMETL